MELDKKDWKLLWELDLNSRQSLQSLGKKAGLSKEVVNYRLKRLVAGGVISSFYARIDTSKLGVLVFRTFLRLHSLMPEKQSDLIRYIVSNPRVGWCVSVDGNWDINCIYWADSTHEFSDFWHSLQTKYGDFIEDKKMSIFDRYTQYPKSFLAPEKPSEIPQFVCGGSETIDLDSKNLKILSLLAANSRMPTLEIAKKIGLSAKAVAQRIQFLAKNGLIQGYGIGLGLQKIGFEYYKVNVNIKRFDQKRFDQLLEFCRYQPNVIYTNELIGGADLELDMYVQNREKFHQLLNELRHNFSDIIKNTETLQYFDELKHNLFPRKIS